MFCSRRTCIAATQATRRRRRRRQATHIKHANSLTSVGRRLRRSLAARDISAWPRGRPEAPRTWSSAQAHLPLQLFQTSSRLTHLTVCPKAEFHPESSAGQRSLYSNLQTLSLIHCKCAEFLVTWVVCSLPTKLFAGRRRRTCAVGYSEPRSVWTIFVRRPRTRAALLSCAIGRECASGHRRRRHTSGPAKGDGRHELLYVAGELFAAGIVE